MTNKLEINDLRPVLSHCTHLIYRYAGMNLENQEVILLYPNIDTGTAKFLPLLITHVKRNFPDLKVYLGIGGNDVPYEKTHEYRTFVSFIQVSQLGTIVTYKLEILFIYFILIYSFILVI